MSELKIVAESAEPSPPPSKNGLPVPVTEAGFTRRDLDQIKRDLITVRKDYSEIRNNLVILTHQHSSAPSRGFFITFGAIWLVLLGAMIVAQPHLAGLGDQLSRLVMHR